ncbi:MAG: SulP family inorganic anion transporter, partial [Actinomycetes bacterium]
MFNWFKSELVVFPTLRGYRRNWLGRDLLAGITFGAITIPGQLATARLAGMPPITGLYGFFAACVIATIVST